MIIRKLLCLFSQGQHKAYEEIQFNSSNDGETNSQVDAVQAQELRKMASYWKSEFEKEKRQVEELANKQKRLTISNNSDNMKKLEEERNALNKIKSQLEQDKSNLKEDRMRLEQQLADNADVLGERKRIYDEQVWVL